MKVICRAVSILATVFRFRLDTILYEIRGGRKSTRLLPSPKKSSATRLRAALERLGPVFVKFGQILSTRRDLLSEDYAQELAKLQDQVPSFSSSASIARIETDLSGSIESIFVHFDPKPIASASLAQVHSAQRHDGTEVVVKVIRPGVENTIKKDLSLMLAIAKFLEWLFYDARRLQLRRLVADYKNTILNELDLCLESSNTTKLRHNFAGSPLLYVPKIHADLSTRNVLVMEHINGTPISNIQKLRELGTDMKKLAERGVETFFTQVFEHNFFHADMHPGNIFVDTNDPLNPSYIAIDCAVMGTLTTQDQEYLAQNILAFLKQDYKKIAELHLESGWIPSTTDSLAFETVIRNLCEPIFQKPLSEISFGHFLLALFKAARQFKLEVQPQLVLLQKTLLNIEGLGRQLYPNLDVWKTAQPFMEKWIKKHYGISRFVSQIAEKAPDVINNLPQLGRILTDLPRFLSDINQRKKEQKEVLRTLDVLHRKQTRRWRLVVVMGLIWVFVAVVTLLNPVSSVVLTQDQTILLITGLLLVIFGGLLARKS